MPCSAKLLHLYPVLEDSVCRHKVRESPADVLPAKYIAKYGAHGVTAMTCLLSVLKSRWVIDAIMTAQQGLTLAPLVLLQYLVVCICTTKQRSSQCIAEYI